MTIQIESVTVHITKDKVQRKSINNSAYVIREIYNNKDFEEAKIQAIARSKQSFDDVYVIFYRRCTFAYAYGVESKKHYEVDQKLLSMDEFMIINNIESTVEYALCNPNFKDDKFMTRHFNIILTKKEKMALKIPFSQGSAHTEEPEPSEVLCHVANDAISWENANSFEDWASDFGYDTDSRTAEKIFLAVQSQTLQLKAFLGELAYQKLLYETDIEM